MRNWETRDVDRRFLKLYSGILFNAREFVGGETVDTFFHFGCPEFAVLKERYPIEEVAGRGSAFRRALRLTQWLSEHLSHEGEFLLTHELKLDALTLLGYGFGIKEHGLNCFCKAEILVECCLALGIRARRVGLYPCSPYDTDNHVVAEIYDEERGKWILLDPTTGGYLTDGSSPLSTIEARERFALDAPCTVVLPRQRARNMEELAEKNVGWNTYYAKNCYYLTVETVSGFGVDASSHEVCLLPRGFDCRARNIRQAEFMLENAKKWGWDEAAVHTIERWETGARVRPISVGSLRLWDGP